MDRNIPETPLDNNENTASSLAKNETLENKDVNYSAVFAYDDETTKNIDENHIKYEFSQETIKENHANENNAADEKEFKDNLRNMREKIDDKAHLVGIRDKIESHENDITKDREFESSLDGLRDRIENGDQKPQKANVKGKVKKIAKTDPLAGVNVDNIVNNSKREERASIISGEKNRAFDNSQATAESVAEKVEPAATASVKPETNETIKTEAVESVKAETKPETKTEAEATLDKEVAKPAKKVKEKKAKKTKKTKMRTYQQRQDRAGYLFMTPWIIGFLAFTLFPFIFTIYLSFTEVRQDTYGYVIKFVGGNNYIEAFTQNKNFVPALISYLQMIIPYTFIVVVLSFIIAYLLNKIEKGKGLLRTIYFLPVIIMSGPVMQQLLTVKSAGADAAAQQIAEATSTTNAYSDIFIMQIIQSYSPALANGLAGIFDQLSIILWFTGIPIVLFINGLQKINPSIYEAAKIDSANAWQIMWKITIPMIKQVGLIISVFTIIQLGMYESINPVYEQIEEKTGNTQGGFGYAATYAWIYSIIVLALIGIIFLIFKDRMPKDIKARKKQEKKLKKLDKQQKRRMASQRRHQRKEAKLYGK